MQIEFLNLEKEFCHQCNYVDFAVVLLYTSESCAFCQVASHVFYTLKRLIPADLVEFVSVDASANDLPWAFTALAVPSVLYFHPTSLKSSNILLETRAFPMAKELSVPNLLSFIVANLEGQTRVKLALSICGDDCLQDVKVELAKKQLKRPELHQEAPELYEKLLEQMTRIQPKARDEL